MRSFKIMDSSGKIVGLNTLIRRIKAHRRAGKKIAFTNGCFDILHYGHVRYLEKAKQNGRVLIVAVNSDRSVKTIKGKGRPVNSQRARASVLAALACVDFVTVFDGATPYELIKSVKPDVLIKGADWKGKEIAGSDIVRAVGGKVELLRFEAGFSTTKIIDKIKVYA